MVAMQIQSGIVKFLSKFKSKHVQAHILISTCQKHLDSSICIEEAGIAIHHSRGYFSILQGPERDWRGQNQGYTRDLQCVIKSAAARHI